MKNIFKLVLITTIVISTNVYARDTVDDYSIKDAMKSNNASETLGSEVRFYFGNQAHKKVKKEFVEIKTNKKTNAFNKSDLEACEWAFLSAMIAFKKKAAQLGGNAVINIKSNYKNNLTSSNETFKCGAGTFVAGVALVGTVVTL